jgi:hypothetical protein
LPPAVEKTVAEQAAAAGTLITGFSREVENGQTMYQMELTVKGTGRDVLMDSTGAIVEVEDEMLWDVVPAAVKAGILNAAGKNKVLKVESVSKGGQVVRYEAKIDKKGEVSVDSRGKPVKKG